MYSKETTVINSSGLHARPASDFVKEAKTYSSKITINRVGADDEDSVSAKSIVMLLSLGVGKGDTVTITADGEDEETAVDNLVKLVESGFGEE